MRFIFMEENYLSPRRRVNKRQIKVAVVILLVLGLIGIAFLVKGVFKGSTKTAVIGAADERIQLPESRATTTLNKEYSFPLKNDKGEEVSKIKYIIETAELRDQIIVKGSKASAVKGRTFLILSLKLANDYKKDIEIKSADYIRLSVGNNKTELLAPDIHNDPVSVAAISTKYIRLGFAVNDNERNFKLKVGEISGVKETVDINF